MTRLALAVDPGNERSAYVLFDGRAVLSLNILDNEEMVGFLRTQSYLNPPRQLVVEGFACYGMAVGREVFDTCVWIGRFMEAFGANRCALVYRPEVKLHLCHSALAKDPNVRQALIDRFGPGRRKAIGLKRSPGPLYGVSTHCWSALAVAVTWWDAHANGGGA